VELKSFDHPVAAEHAVVAASAVLGRGHGRDPHELAQDAYQAACEAYDLFLHLLAHADADAAHAATHGGASSVGRAKREHHAQHAQHGHHPHHGHHGGAHPRLSSGGKHHHPIKRGGTSDQGKGSGSGGGDSGGGSQDQGGDPSQDQAQPYGLVLAREPYVLPGELALPPAHRARGLALPRVGHKGGGGGGGGGGHHHHDGGGWAYSPEPWEPVFPVCPPGTLQLGDGECYDPRFAPNVPLANAILDSGARIGGGEVGHHHGGGGHHHHGGAFPIWGGWDGAYWGYPYAQVPLTVLACAPGQLLLADGTCFDPRLYGQDGGRVSVGASLSDLGADGHHFCPMSDDGSVTLPDGQVALPDWELLRAHHAATVGADSSSQFPTSTATDMPAAGAIGTATSGNLEADALNRQWEALAQVVPQCLGPNASLPTSYTPSLTSSTFTDDLAGWREFYAGIGSFGWEDVTGDLSGWQSYANAWGALVKSKCPTMQLPADFPQATPGSWALPLPDISTLTAPGVASAIEWGVIAIALGVGLWLFWPVLVGAKGALAAL